MAWIETLTPDQVTHLDKMLEPKLTPEEQAAKAEAERLIAEAEFERKWETWGESPEQLEAQRRFMAMAGADEVT